MVYSVSTLDYLDKHLDLVCWQLILMCVALAVWAQSTFRGEKGLRRQRPTSNALLGRVKIDFRRKMMLLEGL